MTTNACNLKCEHCYQDAAKHQSGELTTEEGLRLIDQIAKAGFKIMIFSGGEPLLRPDIYELVAHASEVGLRPVFGTNGTLITKEVAHDLKDAGAKALGISLDSLDPEKHDHFRGVDGAYDATMAGIENCREAGLAYQIHTTVLEWNKDEIPSITDFAVEHGAIAHYLFFLIPVGRGKFIARDEAIAVEENETLLRTVMEKQKTCPIPIKPTCAPQFTRIAEQMGVNTRFTRGCLAGLSYCVVGSEGLVRPCAYMTQTAGDVRKQPFDEIWKNSDLFKLLRTQKYEGACGTCDYQGKCGGCRARAANYHDGNLLAQDDYCAHSMHLLGA